MTMIAPESTGPGPSGQSSPITAIPRGDALGITIQQKWRDCADDLGKVRRDYWLNLAYYLGEQWIWWDRSRRIVQQLPQQYSPLGPGRARITVNRIAPNVGSVLGRLLKNELAFEVLPSGVTDDVTGGARRGERVLTAYHRVQDWEQLRFDEVLSAVLGGTSATSLDWDGRAGQRISVDNQTGNVVGTGDVIARSLNITEFGVEPKVRNLADARWWVQGLALPPKTVQSMYGLNWCPKPDTGTLLSPLQHKMLSDSGRGSGEHLCLVLAYYERPNKETPKGKYAVVVNGVTIENKPWPFPFQELNLEIYRQRKVPAQWVGSTYVNDAIPIQFSYNHARSVIAEHMKLSGNARLIAPYGAFEEDALTDDPGSILWWSPDLGGAAPQYLSPPNLPRWMLEEAANLKAELDDVMFVHDTSRGIGFDRASGQALAVLGEKDDGPLSWMVFEQKRGWSSFGKKVLQVLGEKSVETRRLTIPAAPGIPETIEWNGAMLREQYDVQVPLDAVAPRTHAAQQAYAKDLWDRQIITDPRQYARMVGLQPEDFAELLSADATSAQRENLRMIVGYPEIPADFEDHAIHIAEHNRLRKSDAYKYAEPEIKKLIDDHLAFHENLAAEEVMKQSMRAAADPALAAAPQASAPPGSQIPATALEQQAAMARQMQGGAGGGGAQMGPGGTSPGMEGLASMITGGASPTPDGGGGQGSPPPGAMAAAGGA